MGALALEMDGEAFQGQPNTSFRKNVTVEDNTDVPPCQANVVPIRQECRPAEAILPFEVPHAEEGNRALAMRGQRIGLFSPSVIQSGMDGSASFT